MTGHKPSPAISGRGSGNLCTDAQHYTTPALRTIAALMDHAEDEKLRFACAKYLLEQGWGRPAIRKVFDEDHDTLDPELQARLEAMIARAEKLARVKR